MVFMLNKQLSDHSCPVDGGIVILWGVAMVAKIMACPAFFIHDPKHDGMLINPGTTPVWKHLLSLYVVSLIYSSVSFILAVTYLFLIGLEKLQ